MIDNHLNLEDKNTMTEIPNVTLRDTKTTIMAALKKTTEALQAAKAQQFAPAEAKAQAKTQAAQKQVEQKDWDLPSHFATIRTEVERHLRLVESYLDLEKADLDAVIDTKNAATAELEELYGITREAETFAALVQAKNDFAQKVNAELAEKRAETEAYIQEAKAKLEAELTEQETENARKQAQWDYEFARETRTKSDMLQDKLKLEQKAWDDTLEQETKALAEHKADLAKQENELARLRALEAEIPAKLEAAAQEARDKTKRSAAIEVATIKRNHDADCKILEHQVIQLSDAKTALEAKIQDLETKLENAYSQIQGVASKALESQGSAVTTAEVQKAVAAATGGKGR
jgi:hypothetical protein